MAIMFKQLPNVQLQTTVKAHYPLSMFLSVGSAKDYAKKER